LKIKNSKELYERASNTLVVGADSPVSVFRAVGGTPLFIRRAHGSKIEDEDGNSYIDFVCSWGAVILGSAHPKLCAKAAKAGFRMVRTKGANS